MKKKVYWCGFIDDRPNVNLAVDDYGNDEFEYVDVFLSRKEARMRYQDVRKVEIVEVT